MLIAEIREVVALADNISQSATSFLGSLSIVGVGFVKISLQFYDKGTFYVWF